MGIGGGGGGAKGPPVRGAGLDRALRETADFGGGGFPIMNSNGSASGTATSSSLGARAFTGLGLELRRKAVVVVGVVEALVTGSVAARGLDTFTGGRPSSEIVAGRSFSLSRMMVAAV